MSGPSDTGLWKRSLAADPRAESLINALEKLRKNVRDIAGEIHRWLPYYTVHDISHLESLWDTADEIVGSDFLLTPSEAYVFGASALIHDLGMGLAAYPGGIEDLQSDLRWRDLVFSHFKTESGVPPTDSELDAPPASVREAAIADLLRLRHAEQAERLPLASWPHPRKPDDALHLIEDQDLRETYGELIGKIAASHHWNVERLPTEFSQLPAAAFHPASWTVDGLSLAALVRVADAAHLDARRAPLFLQAIRRPSGYSKQHWDFQARLQRVKRDGDHLIFASATRFPQVEASAWWQAFDSVGIADRELRSVDEMLVQTQRPRFAARGAWGAGSAERLAEKIRPLDWIPVDTAIGVSDVARVVRRLGGRALYGDNYFAPLRELIQNAADAVRARRRVEHREPSWGSIRVTMESREGGVTLGVEDSGIGMSRSVLTNALLDFGSSYWGSGLMQTEYPGLLSGGFQPTGQFGIGFFSVFMLGDSVTVSTRSLHDPGNGGRVLEFQGLSERPLMRGAGQGDCPPDGGTRVHVHISDDLAKSAQITEGTLKSALERICLALDVSLYFNGNLLVSANDWYEVEAERLLRRSATNFMGKPPNVRPELLLPVIDEGTGEIIGRLAPHETESAAISVGGLRGGTVGDGIVGLIRGETLRASRDLARPTVRSSEMKAWADKLSQVARSLRGELTEPELLNIASLATSFGANYEGLPIATINGKTVEAQEIRTRVNTYGEVRVVDVDNLVVYVGSDDKSVRSSDVRFEDDVILASSRAKRFYPSTHLAMGSISVITTYRNAGSAVLGGTSNALARVIECIAEAWGVEPDSLEQYDDADSVGSTRQEGLEVFSQGYRLIRPA